MPAATRNEHNDELDRQVVERAHAVISEVVDPETGEVFVTSPQHIVGINGDVVIGRRKNRVMDGSFVMVDQARIDRMLEGPVQLGRMSLRLLFLAISEAEFENEVRLNVSTISSRWNTNRTRVRAAITELIDAGFLAPRPAEPGRVRRYVLNPDVVYKGAKRMSRKQAKTRFLELMERHHDEQAE